MMRWSSSFALVALASTAAALGETALARPITRDEAVRAAIHPVANVADMNAWLVRVPVTRDFPPDFAATLRGQAPAFLIEMSTAPGCIPCADMWNKLSQLPFTVPRPGRPVMRLSDCSRCRLQRTIRPLLQSATWQS